MVQSDDDQGEACQGRLEWVRDIDIIALGDNRREITHSVGLTRRTVEIRQSKIFKYFGIPRIVQIIRMMVPLEENRPLDDY